MFKVSGIIFILVVSCLVTLLFINTGAVINLKERVGIVEHKLEVLSNGIN